MLLYTIFLFGCEYPLCRQNNANLQVLQYLHKNCFWDCFVYLCLFHGGVQQWQQSFIRRLEDTYNADSSNARQEELMDQVFHPVTRIILPNTRSCCRSKWCAESSTAGSIHTKEKIARRYCLHWSLDTISIQQVYCARPSVGLSSTSINGPVTANALPRREMQGWAKIPYRHARSFVSLLFHIHGSWVIPDEASKYCQLLMACLSSCDASAISLALLLPPDKDFEPKSLIASAHFDKNDLTFGAVSPAFSGTRARLSPSVLSCEQ